MMTLLLWPVLIVAAADSGAPIPAGAAFINTWLVAGPFENDAANSGFDRDWIGETSAEPAEGMVVEGREWRWFDDRLFSRNYDDYQDLFSYFRAKRGESTAAKVAYACVYVHSAEARQVQLRVGADNAFKAWVNGTLAASSTESRPHRDGVVADVALAKGWNRLLLKIGNQSDGRFGFYARLCDAEGGGLDGLTYALNPAGDLAVATKPMVECGPDALPGAYRCWPYVALDPYAAPDPDMMGNLERKPHLAAHASPFVLTARGGRPPYTWSLVQGALPEGLSLAEDGTLGGVVADDAVLGTCRFTVCVKDASGAEATGELSMTVREWPAKWYEEGRLVALIHKPESILEAPDADLAEFARVMKRQGYALGMAISYNNGDMMYRWPSMYEPDNPVGDIIGRYKAALEKEGLRFGMYMGNLIGPNHGGVNGAILMVEEAVRRYRPAAFWFDWASPDPDGYESLDALYSMIKSISPDTLIVLNGISTLYQGDWDVICLEGWGAWGDKMWATWPFPIQWAKRAPLETWRLIADPAFEYSKDVSPDWREYLRVQLSVIGEGFVANMDHSPTIATPFKDFSDSIVMQAHQAMADWANPPGLPPLHESYTWVNPGPLRDDDWGYSTINLARDAIYLHMIANPRGKVGVPEGPDISVGPVRRKVLSVRCMNTGKDVIFAQAGEDITLALEDIEPDPVDTIFKLELDGPHPAFTLVPAEALPYPSGNLAFKKSAKLLSVDGSHGLVASGFAFARYGVDGNPHTIAQGAYEWAWAYEVDLGEAAPLRRVVVHFAPGGYATEYQLLLSENGQDWAAVAEVAGCTGGTREHEFEPVSARYVRIRAIKPDGPDQPGGQMGIAELEVYE